MDQLAHTRSIYFPFCLVEKTRILLKTDAYVPYYVFGRPASYSQSSSMHSTDDYILKKPSNVVLRPAAYTYTQTVRDTVCSCITCPEEKRSKKTYAWIGQKYTVYILYMQQVPLARLVVSLGSSACACMCTCIYYMYTHGALFLKKSQQQKYIYALSSKHKRQSSTYVVARHPYKTARSSIYKTDDQSLIIRVGTYTSTVLGQAVVEEAASCMHVTHTAQTDRRQTTFFALRSADDTTPRHPTTAHSETDRTRNEPAGRSRQTDTLRPVAVRSIARTAGSDARGRCAVPACRCAGRATEAGGILYAWHGDRHIRACASYRTRACLLPYAQVLKPITKLQSPMFGSSD